MNNAEVNMEAHTPLHYPVIPLTIYPEVELLDHTIDVSLIVLRSFNLCSIRAKSIYILIESVQAFTFLHILTTLFSS